MHTNKYWLCALRIQFLIHKKAFYHLTAETDETMLCLLLSKHTLYTSVITLSDCELELVKPKFTHSQLG